MMKMMKKPIEAGLFTAQVEYAGKVMNLLASEIYAEVQARADKNHAEAKKRVQSLRELIDNFSRVMGVNYESLCHGPEFPYIYAAVQSVASSVDSFMAAMKPFIAEHRPLVEQDLIDSLDRFAVWAKEQPEKIAPYMKQFAAELDAGLEEYAEDDKAVAREWAGVDSDGIH